MKLLLVLISEDNFSNFSIASHRVLNKRHRQKNRLVNLSLMDKPQMIYFKMFTK